MAQTKKYGLYVVGAGEDPYVKDFIEQLCGENASNMTIIESALDELSESVNEIKTNDGLFMSAIDPVGTGSFSLNRKEASNIGTNSFSEGTNTTASGDSAHAEGDKTFALDSSAHAEGEYTVASNRASHSEGFFTSASGNASHSEGRGSILQPTITGEASATTYNAWGINPERLKIGQTIQYGEKCSIITGFTIVDEDNTSITVDKTLSLEAINNGDAFIFRTSASGSYSHAEGYCTVASGAASHTEGSDTSASGYYSHAEGYATKSFGDYSHAEGSESIAYGNSSHAEGRGDTISVTISGAANSKTYTLSKFDYYITNNQIICLNGVYARITSYNENTPSITLDKTLSSSSEILSANAIIYRHVAQGIYSHVEGSMNLATASCAHAEGNMTVASGVYSHAEGCSTVAYGNYSHVEGMQTKSNAESSHTEGYYTIADSKYQHVQGKYNIPDSKNTYAHIIGNGTGTTARSNAHTVDWDGNAWFAGDIYIGGTGQDDVNAVKLVTSTELDELKTSVSEGKALVTGAVTDKGVSTASDATFATIAANISLIETGGVDISDATATAAQILSGQTAYISTGKTTGTMTNQGAQTKTLNCGESYIIPTGYHNGSGKVTANSLASQTAGDATEGEILSGKTAWVNGTKVTGMIATKTSSNLTVNGATVTVPAGYYASNINKSVYSVDQAIPTVKIGSDGLITASVTQPAGYVSAGTKTATLQLNANTEDSFTSSGATFTIPAGYYAEDLTLTTKVAVQENIGATATVYKESGQMLASDFITRDDGFVNSTISDGTGATAADIASGKTAYVNGSKITGTATTSSSEWTYIYFSSDSSYPSDDIVASVTHDFNDGSGMSRTFEINLTKEFSETKLIYAAGISEDASKQSLYICPSIEEYTGVDYEGMYYDDDSGDMCPIIDVAYNDFGSLKMISVDIGIGGSNDVLLVDALYGYLAVRF